MKLQYIVTEDNIMVKDYFKLLKFSRNFSKKIKLYGKIFINGDISKNHFILKKNDVLVIEYNEQKNDEIVASNVSLDIVYEDEYLLVLNKQSDISCQPSRKYPSNNLVSALKQHFEKEHIDSNIHIVNRLDYSTSGLMLVAKNGFIHQQLQDRIVRKYVCKVHGILDKKIGTIDKPIKRCELPSILRRIDESGQKAITHYRVIKEKSNYSILDVTLETGRTHQIRLHMSWLGHPLYGDKLYSNFDDHLEGLKLHSYYINFIHPITNEEIEINNYPNWYKEEVNA